jgi:hypothetical protein
MEDHSLGNRRTRADLEAPAQALWVGLIQRLFGSIAPRLTVTYSDAGVALFAIGADRKRRRKPTYAPERVTKCAYASRTKPQLD